MSGPRLSGARRVVPRGGDARRRTCTSAGWRSSRRPPDGRAAELLELREHIERRLARAPRYRQKLAPVPLGLHAPEWVDDERLLDRSPRLLGAGTARRASSDEVMSMPLRRDRPLWEMWICEEPPQDSRFAIIGKAHHCMVDGIAAVELGVDAARPDARAPRCASPIGWRPAPEPGGERLLVQGRARPARPAARPAALAAARSATRRRRAARQAAGGALRMTRALSHLLLAAAPASALNGRSRRCAAWPGRERPLGDLQHRQARLRHDGQRRDAGRGRRRHAHLPGPTAASSRWR